MTTTERIRTAIAGECSAAPGRRAAMRSALCALRRLALLAAAALVLHGYASGQAFNRQLRSDRRIISGGLLQQPDSAAMARADSIRIASLVDSLRAMPSDSLAAVADSVRLLLPDSLHRQLFADFIPADSLAADIVTDSTAVDSLSAGTLTDKQLRRIERRENRQPLLSDSMPLRKVCLAATVLPGYGQIYNKQYWKLPILYGTVGASLGMCIYENSKFKPLKKEFDYMTDQSLMRTDELNSLQTRMIRHNTWRQVFMLTTIASYLYFIGDAAVCYSTNEVSSVSRATTLATICPGAGQIYNKSYWRVPIVVGGFATTVYCIDWNNRGYQRFKKAYRLKFAYDAAPEEYPQGSLDEFRGRYSATFLKNLRNSYRRNRDLCIILTAGLYILQIVDAHVDAHLRDYDISDDLGVNLQPMIDYSYNPVLGGGRATVGMSLNFTF